MKIQKRFIVKALSALCATGTIAMTMQPIVSANPQKGLTAGQANNDNQNTIENESDQNINQNVQNNQDVNEIIDNNPKIDPIKMYTTSAAINKNIIDENSQDPKHIDRNERRRIVNFELLGQMMGIHESDDPDQPVTFEDVPDLALSRTRATPFCRIVDEHVEDEFDRFMYFHTVVLREYSDISEYLPRNKIGIDISTIVRDKNVNFNFLSTKSKISKMLLDQEKDLIKKFLLKIECREIFKAFLKDPTNLSKETKNPYHCKQAIETFYFDALKEYYKDGNIEYDINANNLEAKKEAYEAALLDAENQTESDLNQKDDIFKKTYYETYALANAEIDAKAYRGRKNKLIKEKDMQQTYKKIYDDQYNEVVKQIGDHDGQIINSRKIFENDPIAQKNYGEGYLNGVRKKAREDAKFLELNYEEYQCEKARSVYLQAFENVVYKRAVDYSAIGKR